VYVQVRLELPLSVNAQLTARSVDPVSKVSRGVPVTVIASEKLTAINNIRPSTKLPFVSGDVTPVTVGPT
jgi:hypothetical protein